MATSETTLAGSDPGAIPKPSETGTAAIGDIELAYESFGDSDAPPMLLVMGLGMQLLGWDARFCGLLAERGYRVIRFDNRDVGLSTKLKGKGNVLASMAGVGGKPAYLLADMAADTVGLLDFLGIEKAHLVGASMGGMISQLVAIDHPDRSLSLCSIMSTPGGRRPSELPKPRAMRALLSRPPREPEAFAEHMAAIFKVIGSPAYPADPAALRDRTLVSLERGYHPAGTARQLIAVTNSPDRRKSLSGVRCPAAVIHGMADPLVRPAAGRATAAAIPGAKLHLIEGMGHDLPPALYDRLIRIITENADRARDL